MVCSSSNDDVSMPPPPPPPVVEEMPMTEGGCMDVGGDASGGTTTAGFIPIREEQAAVTPLVVTETAALPELEVPIPDRNVSAGGDTRGWKRRSPQDCPSD